MEPQATIRRQLSVLIAATLLAFVFSLWVHWPWLQAEHHRLEPGVCLFIWSGDAAALGWFVWFGIRYCLLGRPLPDTSPRDTERRYLLVSLLGAISIDAAVTGFTAYHEISGASRSAQVHGEIIGGRPTANEEKAYLISRFQDGDLEWHESHHQVNLAGQPWLIREAIRQARFPVPVLISYDRDWPQRCWIVNFNNEEDNRLYWLSFAFLVFQLIGLPVALQYGVWKTVAGVVPLYKLVPLWAQLTPFFLGAVAKFAIGEY